MSGSLFDENDPVADAEAIVQQWADRQRDEQSVDNLRLELHQRLIAAAAEDISGDRAEHEQVMRRIGEYLGTVDQGLVYTLLCQQLYERAYRAAGRKLYRAAEYLELHFGAAVTPGEVAAAELDVEPKRWPWSRTKGRHAAKRDCLDPDQHALIWFDVVDWNQHLKKTGECVKCGGRVPR